MKAIENSGSENKRSSEARGNGAPAGEVRPIISSRSWVATRSRPRLVTNNWSGVRFSARMR